jgi:hypothetical protein
MTGKNKFISQKEDCFVEVQDRVSVVEAFPPTEQAPSSAGNRAQCKPSAMWTIYAGIYPGTNGRGC